MSIEISPWIPPARPMEPLGQSRWFAVARVKQKVSGRPDQITRIPGEWHGRTKEQAEARARRAAEEWIAQRKRAGNDPELGSRD